jgi:hypothetical protein
MGTNDDDDDDVDKDGTNIKSSLSSSSALTELDLAANKIHGAEGGRLVGQLWQPHCFHHHHHHWSCWDFTVMSSEMMAW